MLSVAGRSKKRPQMGRHLWAMISFRLSTEIFQFKCSINIPLIVKAKQIEEPNTHALRNEGLIILKRPIAMAVENDMKYGLVNTHIFFFSYYSKFY